MAAIEFRLRTEALGIGDVTTVTPYVDGVSLVELARRVESGPARADRQPDLAGAYAGLVVGDARWQDWYSGADPQVWFGDGDSCLLGCTCGETGCWPLTATVTVGPDTVVWDHFRTGHRRWDLAALGPFTFSRAAYDAALTSPTPDPA
ncbi:MAG TPA: hypothetical protein VLM05_03405 [Mycobacteriales bacterium]|nr:hypothetical protein [Mycobacteriales bacterium]